MQCAEGHTGRALSGHSTAEPEEKELQLLCVKMAIGTVSSRQRTRGRAVSKTKLKAKRQKEGLTQVEVAEKAHIAKKNYQRYESGERIPRVDTAILIAKALNSTVEELF